MNGQQFKQLEAMMAVIYKRLDEIEHKIKGGGRTAPLDWFLRDLRKEAAKAHKNPS